MRAFATLLLAAFMAVALTQSLAQGAPAAKKTATIPVPNDANAAVAHLVLKATKKKGKKPKKAVKRPKLKVSKAPKGVVVAASYKRDAKNKNRWHATVAITNPVGAPAPRIATASSGTAQDEGDVVITVIQTDGEYIFVIQTTQIEENVTYADQPSPPLWMDQFCDPNGSSGDAFLLGQAPDGVTASEFLRYGCGLGNDEPLSADNIDALDLAALVMDLDPFPGNPAEFVVTFELVNIEGVNAIALKFPGQTISAFKCPTGRAGVVSGSPPSTVTCGNRSQPYVEGEEYTENVRFGSIPTTDTAFNYTGQFTKTYAPPYSNPFPGFGP